MPDPVPSAAHEGREDDYRTGAESQRMLHLTTFDQYHLAQAIRPLREAFGFGSTFLVGSVMQRRDFRDVDIRVILDDDEFDAVFGTRKALWSVFCYAVTAWLRAETGLPIDFQVQRFTEANEQHSGQGYPRSALGLRTTFAGGGDATRFEDAVESAGDPDA